ncbi:S-adenosylmethionine sensor upstream of mTORC1 [Amphibalanus amphitrite]|uniref:S-adenosylmethionine sensor upstream of mTORC1 n=1 Tax=Amphibalanus amphitrite TaxID=1232801 RepID=A0A6A4WW34_AMPAM|nr:S-adenosylmethionine sensor upstream of mTORC1 [Amphibalanus amphitrite]
MNDSNAYSKTDSCQAECAGVIKRVHAELRAKCQDGSTAEDVWRAHVSSSNDAVLSEYATSMRRLATDVWDRRHGGAPELSRISWLHEALLSYHSETELARARAYDDRLAARHGLMPHQWPSASELTSLEAFDTLDVGSCYGPFCGLPRLRVTALDLCPAAPTVLRGDLLSVPLNDRTEVDRASGQLLSLATGAWHAVIFCLLLEYLPTPRLRYECCRRAAQLLRTEGSLLVASPDSAHRTANGPLYRAWRLALATLGLVRVRYEKTEHLHCMVFRKSAHPEQVAQEALSQIAQDAARGRLVWSRHSKVPGSSSEVPEGPSASHEAAPDCPEPYQLMVIHQDLKPTVLKTEMERTVTNVTGVVEALSELPLL